MRLDSRSGGGARVCMRWDGRGACGVVGVSRNGVGIGWDKGFSDRAVGGSGPFFQGDFQIVRSVWGKCVGLFSGKHITELMIFQGYPGQRLQGFCLVRFGCHRGGFFSVVTNPGRKCRDPFLSA